MRTNRLTRRSVIAIVCACCATAALSAEQRDTQEPPSPSASGLNGYSVVLVVGDTDSAGKSDAVPPAAQKALNDIQAFLPYKHYHLLDSAWMLCCTAFGEMVSGRIDGPDGREYGYSIRTNPADAGRLNVHFSLMEAVRAAAGRGGATNGSEGSAAARAAYSQQLYEATKDRDEARMAYDQAKRRQDVGLGQENDVKAAELRLTLAEQRIRELQGVFGSRGGAGRAPGTSLMDNSFYIAPGETVVIGTSRLNGGQALVALLTAVPRSGGKR